MKQMQTPNNVASTVVDVLEGELKVAKERAAEEQFLNLMDGIKAKRTDFKCQRCNHQFWFAKKTAHCRCGDMTWGWGLRTERCFICKEIVEYVVRDKNSGYEYHSLQSQHFKTKQFTTLKVNYDQVPLCTDCNTAHKRRIAEVSTKLEAERQQLKRDKTQCKYAYDEYGKKKKDVDAQEIKVHKLEQELSQLTGTGEASTTQGRG